MSDLRTRSIGIIEAAQRPSGAIIASPTFPTYRYCWFRDSSFVAYAMGRVGRHEVSARFFDWSRATVERRAARVEEALRRRAAGEQVRADDLLHCRYAIDGSAGTEAWGNFQMDGYGALLWALAEHGRLSGREIAPYVDTARLLARYIAAFWELPQYDCWEERPDRYVATLACLYGGLQAVAPLLPAGEAEATAVTAEAIRRRVLTEGVSEGRLAKTLGGGGIDASLLWCVVPFGLVAVDDPIARTTVAAIERLLLRCGLHRFPEDTYYGGGAWILLTAWLGWYYALAGRVADAARLRDWIASQADPDGGLPEQVQDELLAPAFYEIWVDRWGPPAVPLVWSHAMYLVLDEELNARSSPEAGRAVVAER